MTKPRWKSRIRWDDNNQTTHEGRTYELWAHGYNRGKNGPSGRDAWHLHAVLANGRTHPEPISHVLGENKRVAKRLAELLILGWRNAPGYREPGTSRERWRDPDGELHALDDVLSGAIPH